MWHLARRVKLPHPEPWHESAQPPMIGVNPDSRLFDFLKPAPRSTVAICLAGQQAVPLPPLRYGLEPEANMSANGAAVTANNIC